MDFISQTSIDISLAKPLQVKAQRQVNKKRSIKLRPPKNTHTHVPKKQRSVDTPLSWRRFTHLQRSNIPILSLEDLYILYICHSKDAIRIFLILLVENPNFDANRVKNAVPAPKRGCAQVTAMFRGM